MVVSKFILIFGSLTSVSILQWEGIPRYFRTAPAVVKKANSIETTGTEFQQK